MIPDAEKVATFKMNAVDRLNWMIANTEQLEAFWMEQLRTAEEELSEFQRGVICGRMDVINFLRD